VGGVSHFPADMRVSPRPGRRAFGLGRFNVVRGARLGRLRNMPLDLGPRGDWGSTHSVFFALPSANHRLLTANAYPLSVSANPRIAAISWLVRGIREFTEGETYACQGCGVAYAPVVLKLAHRSPLRKNRSGGFQAQVFAKRLLKLPVKDARAVARVLCANCHKIETAAQQRGGWR
jgi:hypothetical protein